MNWGGRQRLFAGLVDDSRDACLVSVGLVAFPEHLFTSSWRVKSSRVCVSQIIKSLCVRILVVPVTMNGCSDRTNAHIHAQR